MLIGQFECIAGAQTKVEVEQERVKDLVTSKTNLSAY
jgi:hypothetical protein